MLDIVKGKAGECPNSSWNCYQDVVQCSGPGFVPCPVCRVPLDEVAAVSYVLTEAQYAANEAGDTWVQVWHSPVLKYLSY